MLTHEADVALVIGGYNSSNTAHLVELCELKLPTYFINNELCIHSADEISYFNLHHHAEQHQTHFLPEASSYRIMITSGASCPDALVENVIRKMATLTGNEAALDGLMEQWITV
jgi:4-hydroxy-3-methylbut-2-enyl diphosphate reductase